MSMDAGLHPLASCEAGKKKKRKAAAATAKRTRRELTITRSSRKEEANFRVLRMRRPSGAAFARMPR